MSVVSEPFNVTLPVAVLIVPLQFVVGLIATCAVWPSSVVVTVGKFTWAFGKVRCPAPSDVPPIDAVKFTGAGVPPTVKLNVPVVLIVTAPAGNGSGVVADAAGARMSAAPAAMATAPQSVFIRRNGVRAVATRGISVPPWAMCEESKNRRHTTTR